MSLRDPSPVTVAAVAAGTLIGGLAVLGVRAADSATAVSERVAVAAFRTPAPQSSALDGLLEPTAARSGPTPTAKPAPGASGGPSAAASTAASAAPGASAQGTPTPAPRTSPVPGAAAPAAPRSGPEPGVYRYATQGFEEVDALGGSRHDYPESSTITSSPRGCGTEDRWQPLQERIGITAQCPGRDGLELRATFQQREFFGRSQSQTLLCDPGVLVLPSSPRVGQTWRGRCASDDAQAAIAGRVVALETLQVDGEAVPVVRVLLEGTLTGATRGRSDRELWLRRDGLLVQVVGTTDTDADTEAGEVRYRESYKLVLSSLEPLR